MAQTFTTRSFLWRPKHKVLLAAALYSAILGLLIVLLEDTVTHFRFVRYVSLFCISLLVLAWCHFDSLERRQVVHPWLRGSILVFGMFAIFVYLFKSRGPKQGLRSSGWALLFLLGLFGIMLASAFLWTVILVDLE